jgi:enoyl-CoA hydratase/carnithine racemase
MPEEFQGLVDRTKLPHPEVIEVSVNGHVGLIEMNEPERMNPLGANEMHIHYALLDLHANTDVWCVIITGRGRAFCAGADIRPTYHQGGHDELGWSRAQRLAYKYAFGNMWETLHNFSKPTIAAVNGYALGGGWEVAHMCDFVLASDTAIFGAVEIDVGLPPFANTLPYLAKMVGKHRAMDLAINGRKITAQQAFEWGLVNKVVPGDQLMGEARALADEICARPPISVAGIRQIVNKSMGLMDHYELERAWAYFLMTLDDTAAMRRATVERSPRPEFTAS